MPELEGWSVVTVRPLKFNRCEWHIREVDLEREAWVEMDAGLPLNEALALLSLEVTRVDGELL